MREHNEKQSQDDKERLHSKYGLFHISESEIRNTGLETAPWYVGACMNYAAKDTGVLLPATLQIKHFSL